MRATEIIMNKRDGVELTEEQIRFLIDGYVAGDIPDYQISAWCMAVFYKGMTPRETGFLTQAMIDSGDVINLEGIPGPFVDKHSTGGVGDKVSLILAPIAAACGLKVPMMSGRALGHTGGTLDKLDAIPGFSTALSEERFREIILEAGFAMTGQSEKVVPADRQMYALRDVTATVESIPLITASILSKKFAEGADSLIFDVKCGSGAFMKTREDARALAESLVHTGQALGKQVIAVLTDMNTPLGFMIGNWLEVEESIDALQGKGPEDLMEVTLRLAGWMSVAAGRCKTIEEAVILCRKKIEDGSAYKLFLRNVKLQGGDPDKMMELYRSRKRGKECYNYKAESDGVLAAINAFDLGMAGVALGVGRNKTTDPVEPYAGIQLLKKPGDAVKAGEDICLVYAEEKNRLEAALPLIRGAFTVNNETPGQQPLILEEITAL